VRVWLFRSACSAAEALAPIFDQFWAGALGADQALQFGLQACGCCGVLSSHVGQQAPGAVEKTDAICQGYVGVFQFLVNGQNSPQAL